MLRADVAAGFCDAVLTRAPSGAIECGMGQMEGAARKMAAVPLFPLPNVVLFPSAVLPLHVFEERYKTMVADALRAKRTIAMALLRPGWEMTYYQRPAIEPVVCVGSIISHERLPDGCFNLLLQGRTRAMIVKEYGDRPYRMAMLQTLSEPAPAEIELMNHRQKMIEIFNSAAFASTPAGRQFRDMLSGPMTTAQVADLAAFNILDGVELKQALLAERDVNRRVERVVQELEKLSPLLYSEEKAAWN